MTTKLDVRCLRCGAKRDVELTRWHRGGRHLVVGNQPAHLSDPESGTLVYRMTTAEPCECGSREVVFKLVLDGPELAE